MMSTPSISSPRPVLATGITAPGSLVAETTRRFLQANLPGGAWTAVAFELGRHRDRVFKEAEGSALLSLDVVLSASAHLDLEKRIRLAAYLLGPLGLHVTSADPVPIEAQG